MMEPHEHDFVEPSDIEVDENVYIYQQCHHRPVFGSQYSERWDEYFYEEGDRCEAMQITTFEFDEVYYDAGENIPVKQTTGLRKVEYDDAPGTWEDAVIEACADVEDDWPDPEQDEIARAVTVDAETYVVRWERSGRHETLK